MGLWVMFFGVKSLYQPWSVLPPSVMNCFLKPFSSILCLLQRLFVKGLWSRIYSIGFWICGKWAMNSPLLSSMQ